MYHIEVENESGKAHAPSSSQNLFQKTKKISVGGPQIQIRVSRRGPPGGRGGVKGGAGSPRRRVSGADLRFSSFFQILDHSGGLQKTLPNDWGHDSENSQYCEKSCVQPSQNPAANCNLIISFFTV